MVKYHSFNDEPLSSASSSASSAYGSDGGGSYDWEDMYESKTLAKTGNLITIGITKENLHPPISINLKSEDKEKLLGSESSSCNLPRLVEPVFLLYHLAYWFAIVLTDQYVFQVAEDTYLDAVNSIKNNTRASPEYYKYFDQYDANVSLVSIEGGASAGGGAMAEGTCQSEDSGLTSTEQEQIQTVADTYVLYIYLCRNFPALISTLLICSYGDVMGRRYALFLPLLATFFKSVLYVVVSYNKLPLVYFLVGSFIEGVGGSHITVVGTAYSYVADVVPAESRTVRFSILHSLVFGSIVISNITGGYIIMYLGYQIPFIIVTILFLLTLLYVVFLLPESNVHLKRHAFSATHVLSELVSTFKIYTRKRADPGTRPKLIMFVVIFFIAELYCLGSFDVQLIYALSYPFCLDSVLAGYFGALNAVGTWIGEAIGVKLMMYCMTDNSIAIFSAITGVIGNVMQAFAQNIVTLYIVAVARYSDPIVVPLTRSMMSQLLEPSEQGALQATLSVIDVICDLASSASLNAIYLATLTFFPGFVWLFCASTYIFIILLFVVIRNMKPPRELADERIIGGDLHELFKQVPER